LIEESQIETLQSIRAAKKEYDFLKKEIFNEYRVGLLHGKLPSKEKNQVMSDFKKRRYDILVATPVVEVGIDIPNATIMIIEGSERFGLAQLHQLRGRIGRGKKQSYCFVFSEKESPEVTKRLSLFTQTQNGNILAEKDLEIRGPGNLYGVEQHGYMELKFASLTDYVLIEKARKEVAYFVDHYNINDFDALKQRIGQLSIGQIAKD
jgi:ATP-dependent DNA helicase RecG